MDFPCIVVEFSTVKEGACIFFSPSQSQCFCNVYPVALDRTRRQTLLIWIMTMTMTKNKIQIRSFNLQFFSFLLSPMILTKICCQVYIFRTRAQAKTRVLEKNTAFLFRCHLEQGKLIEDTQTFVQFSDIKQNMTFDNTVLSGEGNWLTVSTLESRINVALPLLIF